MNVPKAVIKTVENQRSASLIFGLFGCSLLGGCSLFGEGSGVSNGSDPARGVLPLLDRPPLMRLGDGRVDVLSLEAIQSCEHRLGLAAEDVQLAHSTNFGEHKAKDSWDRLLQVKPMVIVLHETVISEAQPLALFKNHPDDDQ